MIDLDPAIMFDVPRRDVFRIAGAGGASLVLDPPQTPSRPTD
jgi:hypothetical protein